MTPMLYTIKSIKVMVKGVGVSSFSPTIAVYCLVHVLLCNEKGTSGFCRMLSQSFSQSVSQWTPVPGTRYGILACIPPLPFFGYGLSVQSKPALNWQQSCLTRPSCCRGLCSHSWRTFFYLQTSVKIGMYFVTLLYACAVYFRRLPLVAFSSFLPTSNSLPLPMFIFLST